MGLEITDQEFQMIADFMYESTGVRLRDTKKPLVISRLRKRLSDLSVNTFSQYYQYLKNPINKELEIFVNAITTNETYFFRSEDHFEFLKEVVIKDILERKQRELKIWSAASSTGEEPYTIAMVLMELGFQVRGLAPKLFASDINSSVLAEAQKGEYGENKFRNTPPELKAKYFIPKITNKETVFILKDTVKKLITFKQHNLKDVFPQKDLDVVFLRNVMIYFDKPMRNKVIENIVSVMRPGGYLFLGHSEGMFGMEHTFSLKYVKPSIFRKDSE